MAQEAHRKEALKEEPVRTNRSALLSRRSQRCQRAQRGQSLTEYALIVVLVAIVALAAVKLFGKQIQALFSGASKQISQSTKDTPAPVP
jgi:Flp pilus assembly pilin Flp